LRLNRLDRRVHYWTSAFVALPLIVIAATGVLLQLKKQWAWVQPPELRGTGTEPALDLEQIRAAVRGVPELEVDGWDDVNRLDLRPSRGIVKVWLVSGWEAQVDLGTGRVLQSAYRRSDLLESIHDGSFFAGDATKLGLFLPVGIALVLLWFSGVWLFLVPFVLRRRRARIVAELGLGSDDRTER
jgi:uncharacterized iron-regulated membrane protein